MIYLIARQVPQHLIYLRCVYLNFQKHILVIYRWYIYIYIQYIHISSIYLNRESLPKQNFQNYHQWLFVVPLKGGRWHIIHQLAVYTTYIPLIVLAFWKIYMPPIPPLKGTRNNRWYHGDKTSSFHPFFQLQKTSVGERYPCSSPLASKKQTSWDSWNLTPI